MKVILAAIGQLVLDWIGFQFLDEVKRLVLSPTMAASTQAYIGLAAIIGATALACYLFYRAYKWVGTARLAIREMEHTSARVPSISESHVDQTNMGLPQSPIRFQEIYGADELLKLLDNLESKGRQ